MNKKKYCTLEELAEYYHRRSLSLNRHGIKTVTQTSNAVDCVVSAPYLTLK